MTRADLFQVYLHNCKTNLCVKKGFLKNDVRAVMEYKELRQRIDHKTIQKAKKKNWISEHHVRRNGTIVKLLTWDGTGYDDRPNQQGYRRVIELSLEGAGFLKEFFATGLERLKRLIFNKRY